MGKAWNCNCHTDFVFSLSRPTTTAIEKQVTAASRSSHGKLRFLTMSEGFQPRSLPFGFARDFSRSCIGWGEGAFAAARRSFERWDTFDLGWLRVANSSAKILVGQIVAVEAYSLGLWSLNLSRIEDVMDSPTRFGFVYATTKWHVEEGEERFLLELDLYSGSVWYELEAVSRPRSTLARLGYPVTRAFQRRFARDSHRQMRQVAPGRTI